jgi:hypothetical protein
MKLGKKLLMMIDSLWIKMMMKIIIVKSILNYSITIFYRLLKKISCHTLNNIKFDCKDNKNPMHYLSQIFRNSFPNIKLSNTTTKATENIINSLQLKTSHGYEEISMTNLTISAPFVSSPLCYTCNKSSSLGIFP